MGRSVRARGPLRLGLAGGGSDVSPYCDRYSGHVLNATIDRFVQVTADPSPDGLFHLLSADMGREVICSGTELQMRVGELPLHVGVVLRVGQQFLDGDLPPLALRSYSDVPAGSGLGSSSTTCVTLLAAVTEYLGIPLGEYELAQIAWSIEREDLALEGGRQDHYAAAFGGVNFMEFGSGGAALVNPLRVRADILHEFESQLLLYFDGASRSSASIIAEQVANVNAKSSKALEATHAVKGEATIMKSCLLRGDFTGLYDSMNRGWESKRKLASSVSTSRIEAALDIALSNGAEAAKVSGAGGGGFMMVMTPLENRRAVSRALAGLGGIVSSCRIAEEGVVAWRR